jgi:hypothetical protein
MTRKISKLWIAITIVMCTSAHAQTLRGNNRFTLAPAHQGSMLRGFSVVLVEGNLRPGTSADALPPAAAKALADLKDFLPYKTYRLLDTQWTMGVGRMTGQLRGPEGKTYALEVAQTGPVLNDPASLTVSRFALTEVSNSGQPNAQAAWPFSQSNQAGKEPHDAAGQWHFDQSRPLIDTSFRMKLGETVVVGTSRLQADTALIVLLTAVARTDQSPSGGR